MGAPLIFGRSRCAACGHRLGPAELVPVLSFLWLRGRCRHCHAAIPRRLPAIELAALAVAVIAVLADPTWPGAAIDAGFGWTLLTLAAIDIRTFRLPDALSLPLLLAGLAVTASVDPPALSAHAAAAALGYLGLRGLALFYRRLRGIEGIGAGDAKLLAAGGAWLGPQAIPDVLIIAGVTGLAWFTLNAARGQTLSWQSRIPFGPCLALAIWLVYQWS